MAHRTHRPPPGTLVGTAPGGHSPNTGVAAAEDTGGRGADRVAVGKLVDRVDTLGVVVGSRVEG